MKITTIIAFLIMFFTPIQSALISCGLLILFDTITGILASRKRGEKITSGKLKTVVVKMFLYQLTIITAHMLELYMVEWIPFVKIVLGGIATTEFLSIMENISVYTGKSLLIYVKDRITKLLDNNKK